MDDMGLYVLGYQAGKKKGGGVEKYDRIAGLPTVFSFDMADGWRCELCADSAPTDCSKQFGNRYDDWGGEYQSTVTYNLNTKAYYLRIFSGSDLKLVTDMLFNDTYAKWYASNGTDVGDLMKTVTNTYSDFRIASVGGYNTNLLNLPNVNLGYTFTQTINETTTTVSGSRGIIGGQIKFISKGDIDVNVYADFVKAVRKFSDEFNSSSSTT